jgi:hypothetical protein
MNADAARPTVDDYIAALDPARRATAERLRAVLRSAAPEATESIKWAQPVYQSNGPFAALKAFPKHVTLTFWRGAALAESADPTGVLAGEGDRMRHVRFQSADDVPGAALTEIIRAAVRMNAELGDPTKR